MDELTRRRVAVARKIFQATSNPKFGVSLPIQAPDGERPVVVALREDSVGYVFDRVDDYGGSANVVVDLGLSIAIITVTPDPPGTASKASHPIHDDSPMEMLVVLLRDYGPQQCHRIRPDRETRLVGEQELIGA
ncbi:hypothetical protein FRAHR75_230005 [Frankia sp. Hr75.2]|nr:hypothetical protein FRAHR75_230005 [Frankia sp. Hr75.2]